MSRRSPDQRNVFRRKLSLRRFGRSKGRSGQIKPAPLRNGLPYSSYRIVNASGRGAAVGGPVTQGPPGDMFARIRKNGTQIGWVTTHKSGGDLDHVEAWPLETKEEFKKSLVGKSGDDVSVAEIWKTSDSQIHHIPVDINEVA